MSKTQTILTGLRANAQLHLGNYLGGLLPMVRLQQHLTEDQNLQLFVADLHSFTTPIDHAVLYNNIIQNVRFYIAAGIDPDHVRTMFYRQSFVPAHAELAWVLECFTYFGEASRMTEFKDKSDRLGHKAVTAGLFNYPMLMAADILLYDAYYIPLGDDQKQHIELTRTVAERMNAKFGELFTVPASWEEQVKFASQGLSLRIHSLSQPENKMSKSIDDPRGTIGLLDEPKTAAKKVMGATTDSIGVINFNLETQPGISNLLQLGALLTDHSLDEVVNDWQGKTNYGELKQFVAEAVERFLTEFQVRFAAITPERVEAILTGGEALANQTANAKLLRVQQALGLRHP